MSLLRRVMVCICVHCIEYCEPPAVIFIALTMGVTSEGKDPKKRDLDVAINRCISALYVNVQGYVLI